MPFIPSTPAPAQGTKPSSFIPSAPTSTPTKSISGAELNAQFAAEKPTPPPAPPESKGIFSKLADMQQQFKGTHPWLAAVNGALPKLAIGAAKSLAQNTAQLMAKPAVSIYAGVTGNESPVNIPGVGEVSPYTTSESAPALATAKKYGQDVSQEQIDTSKDLANKQALEAAEQSATAYLDIGAPGAGKLISKIPGLRPKQMVKMATEGEEVAKDVLDYTMPKLTVKRGEKMLEKGATEVKGKIFKTEVMKPTEYNKQVAKSVEGVVNPAATATENIHNVRSAIRDTAQKELAPLLQSDKRPFNLATFGKRMDDIPVPRMFKTDATVENTFNGVKEMAKDVMKEFPKTREGAWKARQAFDDAVEREFPRMWDGSEKDTAIKKAVEEVRKSWNGILSEDHPNGEQVTKALDKMSKMYSAMENIAEKNASKIGMSWGKRFATEHPAMTKAAKYTGAAALGAAGVGEAKHVLGL